MRLGDEQLLALWGQTKERKNKRQGIFQPKRNKWKRGRNEACTFVDLLGELIEDTLLHTRVPCGGKLRAWQERWKRIGQVLAVTYRPRLKSMWCDGGESRGRHVIICPFNKVHPSPALRLWVPDPGLCGWEAMDLSEFITFRALFLLELITGIDGFERPLWCNK